MPAPGKLWLTLRGSGILVLILQVRSPRLSGALPRSPEIRRGVIGAQIASWSRWPWKPRSPATPHSPVAGRVTRGTVGG